MNENLPDTNVGNIEYISKQDAVDDLHTQLMYRMGSDDMKRRLDDWVKTLPSADVVQVVRCRKCKYFWTYRCMDSMPIETCQLAQTFYNPDIDFCSLAERREE